MDEVSRKRPHQCTRITMAGVAVVVLCILYGYRNIQGDDSYIFYSYAQNLANGHGYVFNPGERVNATSSPLYTLLLAGFYLALKVLPGVSIPLIAHTIGALALLAMCVFLTVAFRDQTDAGYAGFLPLVFLLNPMLSAAIGMESFLAMSLAVGSLALYVRKRLTAAALLCALAVLARPDMLLLAAVLLAYDIVRHRRLPTFGAVGAFVLPIAAWLVFSASYFGNVIPSTLAAKLAQTEAGLWGEGPVFLKGLFSGAVLCSGISGFRTAVPFIILLLAAVAFGTMAGLLITAARWRDWPVFKHPMFHVILLWNGLYLFTYAVLLDAPAYAWYYTPLTLGIALLMTLPLDLFHRQIASSQPRARRAVTLSILLVLAVIAVVVPLVVSRMPVTARHETHRRAAEWLNAHATAGASVGANDIGVLRFYYEKGPIIDGVGLVTPDVVDHLKRGEYSWYIHHYTPDYLMFIEPPRSPVELFAREDWFQRAYVIDTIIGGSSDGVTIRSRRSP